MFLGPSAGGLVAGPTTGAINTNLAANIPDNGLAIAQINELRVSGHRSTGFVPQTRRFPKIS